MTIKLTNDDGMMASSVAALQMLRRHTMQRSTDHGGVSKRGSKQRWGDTIHGLMAEIALAKFLGKTWTPGGQEVSTGEVGGRIEVRATDHPNGHLLIYPKDSDMATFYLVRGDFPEFDVVGSITGGEAKRKEWWNNEKDPPCFWVPASALTPPSNQTTNQVTE